MEVVFVWVVLALLVGVLAASRGRSGVGFFLLSVLMSPLLGLVIVLVIADLKKAAHMEDLRRREEANKERERAREHEKQLESLRALREAPAPAAPSAPVVSVVAEIERLAALLERGLIDRAEFDSQKAALLARQ